MGVGLPCADSRAASRLEFLQITRGILITQCGFRNGSALAQTPQDREFVLYCKGGIPSAGSLAALKAAGLTNSVHVQGGVLAWQAQVDPSLPTY